MRMHPPYPPRESEGMRVRGSNPHAEGRGRGLLGMRELATGEPGQKSGAQYDDENPDQSRKHAHVHHLCCPRYNTQ